MVGNIFPISEFESIQRGTAVYKDVLSLYAPCEGMRVADIYYITDTSENPECPNHFST